MRLLIAKRADAVHPGSWWLLGLALAVAAGLTSSIWIALSICVFAVAVARLLRTDAPWARSLGFYLTLATGIVVLRLGFRVLFNSGLATENIAFRLKDIELNLGFGPGVHLLGSVSWLTLQSAMLDGLRLAAIVLSVALANTLANPRKLLRATPGALYEVATAISVAINLAPQLIESLNRVRRARKLRGRSKKIGALAGTIIPVLEDTLDRSLSLAASMDARGFGRRGSLSSYQQTATRVLSLTSLAVFAIGIYLLFSDPALAMLAASVLALGVAEVLIVVKISSLKHVRTRYSSQTINALDLALWLASAAVIVFSVSGFGGVQ